jgi:16S rRNA (guanine966-N2)-methyltransferase
MRIISGKYRSRRLLSPPPGSTTRPMPDRVKESLFAILRGNTEGAAVLDVFAGTGAIGLEAVSRGAERCVFVERDRRVAEMLRQNIETLGCGDRCEVVVGDALGLSILARSPRPVDLIFFDPPYPMVQDAMPGGGWDRVRGQFTRLIDLLSDHGFAVLRTPWPFVHPDDPTAVSAEAEPPRRSRAERDRPGGGRSARGRRDDEAPAGGGHGYDPQRDEDFDDESDEEMDLGDIDESEFEDEVDLDELNGAAEGETGGDDEALEAPPIVPHHEVDLHLPNAVGPETHIYRHSALHFYMRRREGAGQME